MKNILLWLLLFSAVDSFCQELPSNFESEPTVKWRFKTNAPIISSPIVSDNVVYFGGLDSVIYALDLNTGNTKWTAKTNGEIRSTFSIHESKLFVVGGNGVLSCWDKSTGKSIWRTVFDKTALFLAERKYDFADYYTSSPLIQNNIIYFGSCNGFMRAINATNGDLIWSHRAQDIVHTTPVIYNDKIFFGSFDGNVYALKAQNGELIWKFKSIGQSYFPLGEIHGSLAVSATGLIHVGSRDYNIYALDANSGNSTWNKVFDAWAVSHTVRDSALYVGTSDNRVLVSYEAATGRQYWKTDVKFNIFGGCAFTKSMVYVGTIWGKLYGLDCKTGKIKWSFATDGHRTTTLWS
jgi:outer membrane protein assembly factor BamB